MEFGKTNCNCGDWVKNCTALVEREDFATHLGRIGRFTNPSINSDERDKAA